MLYVVSVACFVFIRILDDGGRRQKKRRVARGHFEFGADAPRPLFLLP